MCSYAQVVTNKDQFRQVFVDLVKDAQQSFKQLGQGTDHAIKDPNYYLPGATTCEMQNGNYFATYQFPDKQKSTAFVQELKALLEYSTAIFKFKVNYSSLPGNPDYLMYYLSDSAGFLSTANNVFIHNPNEKKPEVILGVGAEHNYSYFVNRGLRRNNPALTNLVKEVGLADDDMGMKKILGTKIKSDEDVIQYTSKRTLPGYKASVYIPVSEESNIVSVLALERSFKGNEELLYAQTDSLIMQVKAALPDRYSFYTDTEEQTIYFNQLPYVTNKDTSVFRIKYGKDEKGILFLILEIERMKE